MRIFVIPNKIVDLLLDIGKKSFCEEVHSIVCSINFTWCPSIVREGKYFSFHQLSPLYSLVRLCSFVRWCRTQYWEWLTFAAKKSIKLFHHLCLHDLFKEGILLLQLLRCETFLFSSLPVVIIQQLNESGISRLGEELLLIDVSEESAGENNAL